VVNSRALPLRYPLGAVFVAALIVRLAVVVISHLFHLWPLIPDEGSYVELAVLANDGRVNDYCCGGYGPALYDSVRLFSWQLHGLVALFGPVVWLLQMPAVIYGAIGAFVVARTAIRFVSECWALLAGLVIAFAPSAVLHSSAVLRESLIWLLVAAIALLVVSLVEARSLARLTVIGIGLFAGLVGVGWLRGQTAIVLAWSLVPTALMVRNLKFARFVIVLSLLVVAPWLTGSGPAGLTVVGNALPRLGTVRAWMSMEAESSHVSFDLLEVEPPVVEVEPPVVEVEPPVAEGAGASAIASRSAESITVDGRTVGLVPTSAGTLIIDNSAFANVSAMSGGLLAFLFRPWPWEWSSQSSLIRQAASAENLLWLVGYVLALFGVRPLWRTQPALLVFIASYCSLISIVASLTQGNLGTAFRHRIQILWAVALLGSIGGEHILGRLQARRAPPDSPT